MHCPQWDSEALTPPVSLMVAGIQVQGEVEVVAWLVEVVAWLVEEASGT